MDYWEKMIGMKIKPNERKIMLIMESLRPTGEKTKAYWEKLRPTGRKLGSTGEKFISNHWLVTNFYEEKNS